VADRQLRGCLRFLDSNAPNSQGRLPDGGAVFNGWLPNLSPEASNFGIRPSPQACRPAWPATDGNSGVARCAKREGLIPKLKPALDALLANKIFHLATLMDAREDPHGSHAVKRVRSRQASYGRT
jgi:hypothetical protein